VIQSYPTTPVKASSNLLEPGFLSSGHQAPLISRHGLQMSSFSKQHVGGVSHRLSTSAVACEETKHHEGFGPNGISIVRIPSSRSSDDIWDSQPFDRGARQSRPIPSSLS
jgi:hypothetical protein